MELDYYSECTLQAGQQLKGGKYTIKKKLGQGGFGITYLATTPAMVKGELGEIPVEVEVVVKEFFMKEECGRATDGRTLTVASAGKTEMVNRYREKFKSEARLLQKMKHPHIVRVVDFIDGENNTVYYVMEYLTGETLMQKVKPNGALKATPLQQEQAVNYVKQIASALKLMHSRKMCHLDVKPDNIMLDRKGNAVLIDFGLAKNYRNNGQQMTSMLIGATPGFSPLEQLMADLEDFKPLSDIYSLGATLYFLLTGNIPRPADMHMEKVLPWGQCDISDQLWQAIQQCMQADYAKRPQDIDAMLKLLEPSAPEEESPKENNDTVVILPTPTPRPLPWKRIAYIAGSAAILALLVWGIVSVFHTDEPTSTEELIVKQDTIATTITEKTGKKKVENISIMDESGKLLYTYSGEIADNMPNGEGTAIYPKGDPEQKMKFEGRFAAGKRVYGTLTWTNGNTFVGSYEDDKLKEGKVCLEDGSYYEGTFVENVPYNGNWYNADGSFYANVVNGK